MSTSDDSQPPHNPYAKPSDDPYAKPSDSAGYGSPQSAPDNPYGRSDAGSAPDQYGQGGTYGQTSSYGQGDPYGQGAPARNGLGTAGLVLGIIAFCLCWVPLLGLLLAVIALPMAIVGRRRVSRRTATNGGTATAGIALSAVALVLSLASTVLFLAAVGSVIDVFGDCSGLDGDAFEQCVEDGFNDAF